MADHFRLFASFFRCYGHFGVTLCDTKRVSSLHLSPLRLHPLPRPLELGDDVAPSLENHTVPPDCSLTPLLEPVMDYVAEESLIPPNTTPVVPAIPDLIHLSSWNNPSVPGGAATLITATAVNKSGSQPGVIVGER